MIVLSAAEMAKVVPAQPPAAVDLHSSSDNNVAAVVAMAHVAHAATALHPSEKDKDKATVADLQKVRVMDTMSTRGRVD